jgi:tetratricopeptide (TPR) repeat protein
MLCQRIVGRLFVFISVLFLSALFIPSLDQTLTVRAQTSQASDVVLVLPFENKTSDQPEANWIGESFADQLSEMLNIPGLAVISNKQRERAYQNIGLPLNRIPSQATAIKLALTANATMVVLGNYSITPAKNDLPISVYGSAKVIKIKEGRLMGETLPNGAWKTRNYDFGDAVTELQKIQARLAYQILLQRFPQTLTYSAKEFESKASQIPPKAFEAFIKGVLTKDLETRVIYLKNAMKLYSDAFNGKDYPQAAFELGHAYFKQNDWRNASELFSKLQRTDRNYAEAAFYAGLSFWRLGDYKNALNVVVPLADEYRLTGIYINTGAISALAARDEKNPTEKTRLLNQAATFLERAAMTSPDDLAVRFNYGYALFVLGKHAEAVEQLRPVVQANEHDGQALFLLAKSLEKLGKTEEALKVDDQARRYLQAYAKWQTEWQKTQSANTVALFLRQSFPRDEVDIDPGPGPRPINDVKALLEKARQLMTDGNDDEALKVLRQILAQEPTNAEAYYLFGNVHQRSGDQEAAISALKTSVFWDNKFIQSHVLLARIYMARGECAQAKAHARNAIQINKDDQEAIALQRLLEMGNCK